MAVIKQTHRSPRWDQGQSPWSKVKLNVLKHLHLKKAEKAVRGTAASQFYSLPGNNFDMCSSSGGKSPFADAYGHPWSLPLLTVSIAPSASRRYLVYSEADFDVFRPPPGSTLHRLRMEAKFHPHRCNDKGVGPQN